jgi:hypothetical protein
MGEEEYVVRTKSGSFYPVTVKKPVFGHQEVTIQIKGKDNRVSAISDESDPQKALHENMVHNTVSESHLRPGKVIFFEDAAQKLKLGNTSRIERIYKKVA